MIKKARARHAGPGLRFTIRTGSGHDLAVDDEAGNTGPRPTELLLAAQAACTAFDVASILAKKRQDVAAYEVIVTGEQRDPNNTRSSSPGRSSRMNVLVAYATRHGATRGIAQRIGEVLEGRGLEVSVEDVDHIRDISGHDAFVLGSAAYMGSWLSGASTFARRHRSTLASKPVWLFSSGPVGTETVDAKGDDVRVAAEPKEFAELRGILHPRDEHVFWGAYDPDAAPVGFAEAIGQRVLRMIPAAREALPAGDFRDWPEIDSWAEAIAEQLAGARAGTAAS